MPRGTPFLVGETHGILRQPENIVHASSDRFGWTSLYASTQRELPFEATFAPVKDQLIIQHLDGPVFIDRLHGSGAGRYEVPAGGLVLFPGGYDFGVRLAGALSTLHVYIRRAVIEEVASDFVNGDPGHVEISPQFLPPVPALAYLLGAIRQALFEDEQGSAIYIDYLARVVASQLLRRHSGLHVHSAPQLGPVGAIGPTLGRVIDYMRANLEQPLGLDDIAEAAGRSPSQVVRQFRASLGIPPHQYLLVLRVKHAQDMLRNTNLPVAEVALASGFSHQEHLTRVFRRLCGTTPAAYRRSVRS